MTSLGAQHAAPAGTKPPAPSTWAPDPEPAPAPTGGRWNDRAELIGDVLPARSGVLVVGGLLAVVAGSALGLRVVPDRLDAVAAIAALVLQYAVMFGLCVAAVQGSRDGSLRRTIGLGWSRRDLRDGVLGWLSMIGVTVVATNVLLVLGVPLAANNPMLRPSRPTSTVPQWVAVGLIGVVLVGVAPFLEELLFRGVLLRVLAGHMPTTAAIVVQAVVFAGFHLDPGLGWGNVGMVVVLSTLGIVAAAVCVRAGGRLGGSMAAHGMYNAVVFALGLAAR